METERLWNGLGWDLYKEHIKKFSHAAVKGMPSQDEMKETFRKLLPESKIKILAQEKVGMGVVFHHLDTCPAPQIAEVEDVKGFLAEKYGGGKFKLNLYHGINFLSTKNFTTEGPPRWKEHVKPDESL